MIDVSIKKRRKASYKIWCGLLLTVCLICPYTLIAQNSVLAEPQRESSETGASCQSLEVIKSVVRYAIDFSYLQTVSPNSIAWIYQPGADINQPVMFSTDSRYYQRRSFIDRLSTNGSIYMTGETQPNFSGVCITLYGKNCLDCSMFGSLSYYRENSYYEQNPTFYLLTPEGDYQLDIFAGIRTKQADETTWKVSGTSPEALWLTDLPRILEQSFIEPNPDLLPSKGDDWAVLATDSYETQGSRYVLYARKRPIVYQTQKTLILNQLDMDLRATSNGYATVPNVGRWMLYAQNDELWKKLVFESENCNRKRRFGDGGCGPTAVAMAIVNLVEKEELCKLADYASSSFGYRFCVCSVNEYWCSGKHLTYRLTTPDEYLRYFPLAVASFATGNNIWGVKGRINGFGTSMQYLEKICGVYDISVVQTSRLSEALTFLQSEHNIAIACTGGYGNPFTKSSHFLVLAGVDEQYLYVLDPLRRTNYDQLDPNQYLEIIVPGLVRVKLENAPRCNLAPIYLLHKN